jgi:hypothetical protein
MKVNVYLLMKKRQDREFEVVHRAFLDENEADTECQRLQVMAAGMTDVVITYRVHKAEAELPER